MSIRKIIVICALCTSLTACATGGANHAPLSVVIKNKPKEQVLDRIASLCQDYGFMVNDVSRSNVTCSRSSGTMAQVFLGTKYGSGVESHTQFTALSAGKKSVRVTPRSWFQNMNAFGGVKKTPLTSQSIDEIRMIFQDLERY